MKFLNQNKIILAGIITGAISGYLYFYFVGCANGTCPIVSNPVNMTVYGAVMGGLLFSMFRKETNTSKESNQSKQ